MKALRKNIIFAAVITAAVLAAVCFLKITPKDEFYNVENPLWQEGDYVTFSIDCRAAAENRDKFSNELQDEKYIPASGYIVPVEKIALEEGDTAYRVLQKSVKYHKIPMDAQGADENSLGTVYVTGINQIYEFSGGELSGWLYTVNGEYLTKSCDKAVLKNGDDVCFIYTMNLGEIFE